MLIVCDQRASVIVVLNKCKICKEELADNIELCYKCKIKLFRNDSLRLTKENLVSILDNKDLSQATHQHLTQMVFAIDNEIEWRAQNV